MVHTHTRPFRRFLRELGGYLKCSKECPDHDLPASWPVPRPMSSRGQQLGGPRAGRTQFRGQTRCGVPPRPPCPRRVTVPGEEPTAGHRLQDGRPDPGQVRPNRTGTVPPRRTREPVCRPAGHHGADPRPNQPRRPLVRAAAPADGARRRRQRVHEGRCRHRPRQWRLWPSSRSTSRHPARSPATGRLAAIWPG